MEAIVATIALTMGASFAAGINLYATIFVLGAMARWTGFELPPGLEVLASDLVMWPALLMYSIEFVADKVPAVDSAWDSIHAFIRIPAGAVLAAGAMGEVPLELTVLGGMVGGALATTSFATKATTRLAGHSTGTSPVVSPVASVAEDVAVIGLLAFVAANPVLSLLILAVMLIAAYFILRTFWKIASAVFKAIGGMFRGRGYREPQAYRVAPADAAPGAMRPAPIPAARVVERDEYRRG